MNRSIGSWIYEPLIEMYVQTFWFLISFKLSFLALFQMFFLSFTHTQKLFAFHILSCLLALKSHAQIMSAFFIMVRAIYACVQFI